MPIGIDGIKALDNESDEKEQTDDDYNVYKNEGLRKERMPSAVRMRCPQYSLGKDQVDYEQQYHARRDEDAGRNGDPDIIEPAGPDDAHDACGDACHAETEHQPGHDELVAAPPVELEDRHMGDGTADEKEEEHGCDRHVEA